MTTIFALVLATVSAAPAPDPLADWALNGLKACMAIRAGTDEAQAASTYDFPPAGGGGYGVRIDRGEVRLRPPTPERTACRTEVSAVWIEADPFRDTVKTFLTTGSFRFVSQQDRVVENVGDGLKARTTVWVGRNGEQLALVTYYEVMGDEYYLGPKILIDYHLMQ
jgi:hypothetical protein